MYSWGHNMRGQLGLGDGLYGGDTRYPNEVPGCRSLPGEDCDTSRYRIYQPNKVILPLPVKHVAAGAYHSVAVLGALLITLFLTRVEDGSVYAWGWNGFGQLGTDSNVPTYNLPDHPNDWTQKNIAVKVPVPEPAIEAACGLFASAVRTGSVRQPRS